VVYPNVSGLAACSENCKWYSSLPLGAVVLLFCLSVSLVSFAAITLCVGSPRVFIIIIIIIIIVVVVVVVVYFVIDSVRKLLETPSYYMYVFCQRWKSYYFIHR
jgi:hypothetical protein